MTCSSDVVNRKLRWKIGGIDPSRTPSTNREDESSPLFRYKGPANIPDAWPQQLVKQYVPPGCSVWRGYTAPGSWNMHYKPYARVSRAFSHEGHEEAARFCLSVVWRRWLKDQNLPITACPVRNLF